jgi:CRP-like cAMP-binding protein
MSRSAAPRPETPANRLLARLPKREFNRLHRRLEKVPLTTKTVLHEVDQAIDYMYFPMSGIVSLLSRDDEQTKRLEVGMVGCEGVTGLPAFLGVGRSVLRSIVQVPGEALRLPTKEIPRVVRPGSALHALLLRYTHLLLAQVSQVVACNALHSVEKRLCRWLLGLQDRSRTDCFPLTHEFLAAMLGVRRASVSEAARRLRRAGLIHYRGGQLRVADRSGLEAATCGCYWRVLAEMERTLA